MKKNGLGAYQQQEKSGVLASEPHALISTLFFKLKETLSRAMHAIEHSDNSRRNDRLSLAIDIFVTLDHSLDHQEGEDIAANLQLLYRYCIKLLIEANRHGDIGAVKEVMSLIEPIHEAWISIGTEAAKTTA